MIRLMGLVGAVVGGWAGWYVGLQLGTTAAFLVSTVASGFGMYYAARWARRTFS
jgi:hypothetical protein